MLGTWTIARLPAAAGVHAQTYTPKTMRRATRPRQ
jgi:hypothetical protein